MPGPETTPAEREKLLDGSLLSLLVSDDSHRPWAIDELSLEVHRDVTDSLNRLHGGGLVHHADSFVWATRAAVMADGIAL
jgi:hypothetical protein